MSDNFECQGQDPVLASLLKQANQNLLEARGRLLVARLTGEDDFDVYQEQIDSASQRTAFLLRITGRPLTLWLGRMTFHLGMSLGRALVWLLRPRVDMAPGFTMHGIADFLFSEKTVQGVVDPMIADLHHEYFRSLNEGRRWKARMIRLRYGIAFAKTLVFVPVTSLVKDLESYWKLIGR